MSHVPLHSIFTIHIIHMAVGAVGHGTRIYQDQRGPCGRPVLSPLPMTRLGFTRVAGTPSWLTDRREVSRCRRPGRRQGPCPLASPICGGSNQLSEGFPISKSGTKPGPSLRRLAHLGRTSQPRLSGHAASQHPKASIWVVLMFAFFAWRCFVGTDGFLAGDVGKVTRPFV